MAPSFDETAGDNKDDGRAKPPCLKWCNFCRVHTLPKLTALLLTLSAIYHCSNNHSYSVILPLRSDLCTSPGMCGMPTNDCVVYSFGISNHNFRLDHALAQQGCDVHGFDPSPEGLQNRDAYQQSYKTYFHRYGIGSQNKKYGKQQVHFRYPAAEKTNEAVWTLYRLDAIQKQLNHPQLTLLKMDVDGGEWDVLQELVLQNPTWRELAVRLHFPPSDYTIRNNNPKSLRIERRAPAATSTSKPVPSDVNAPAKIDRIQILKQLSQIADLIYFDNQNCDSTNDCVEVYFLRKENPTPVSSSSLRPNQMYMGA